MKKNRPKILIVDDKRENRYVLAKLLAALDVDLVMAESGNKALIETLHHHFALILLDIQMPEMDGFETVELMRQQNKSAETPVIFLTANFPDKKSQLNGYRLGAVDYLLKPIDETVLLCKVKVFLLLHNHQVELANQSTELQHEVARRIEVEKKLTRHQDSLVIRVEEGTEELKATCEQLQAEVEEHLLAREKLQLFRDLIDQTNDALFIIDADSGRLLDVNDASCQSTGYTADELKSMGISDLNITLDDEASWTQTISRLRQESVVIKGVQRHRDGSTFPVEIGARLVSFGGHEYVVSTTRDITSHVQAKQKIRELNNDLEQRVIDRTAELETANYEMKAFSYSVSHDLRAPLRHMDGFLNLLRQHINSTLDDKGRRYLNIVSDSSLRMGRLIDDILDLSRVSQVEIKMKTVDIEKMVKEVVRDFQPETKDRKIVWKIDELPKVHADASLLRLVITNLISNAVKYTGQQPRPKIEFGGAANGENEVVFFVRDNGVGFDMQYIDKLFGVFQRLHGKDEFEGTGIGLANVRRIIGRHGGKTWADGQLGKGATFYFSLTGA